MRVPSFHTLSVLAAALVVACGGDKSGPTNLLELQKWTPSGENQTDTVGQVLPKVIRVKVTLDSVPVAGYTVHFAGGNLGTTDVVTGADGIATSSWTLGTVVGAQTVTASVTGALHSPQTFHATAVHDTAAELVMLSGDGQVVIPSVAMQQIVVKVTDAYTNPVSGRWIQFAATGPVQIGSDSIISLDDGRVLLNLQSTNKSGPWHVTATAVPGLTGSPLNFSGDVVPTITTINVGVGGSNIFSPSNPTITAGSAVQWQWGTGTHSVTPDTTMGFADTDLQLAPFKLGPIIFNDPGVFRFHCSAHGTAAGTGMAGTVTVN